MVDDGELYSNLLKATDNLQDITFTRYATVTKLLGNGKCDVKESDNELIHNDVPILNGLSLLTGDTVVLGFVQNSLYNAFVVGVLNRELGSGGGGGLEFCQALVDAYTTYTLTLSETEITTVTGDVTIIATLKANDTLLVNKTVVLYDGSTLVATETTDNNGVVTFNTIINTDTLFTVNYDDKVTATCTVYYKPYTFPLDGTDTIVNKRGTSTTGNGILTIGNSGKCYLTDYYLKNNELWTLSYEYYHTNNNWRTWLIVITDTSRDITLVNYPPTTTYDRWVKVEVKKINSTQAQITVDNGTPTTTTVGSWAGFYFGVFSWTNTAIKIKNIRFDPATPNE